MESVPGVDVPAAAGRRAKRPARGRTVRVRVSAEEHAALAAKAREAGLTVSALLRDHLGQVTVRDREAERQRNALLNRINANLNMIAKWVNTYKSAADRMPVVSRLDAVRDEVLMLLDAWEGKGVDRGILKAWHR